MKRKAVVVEDDIDTDVVFISSDGDSFLKTPAVLQMYAGKFPTEEDGKGTVKLTEDTAVLELLFQFMSRQRHPHLLQTDMELLLKVSEAAEKYEVYSAMGVCVSTIRLRINEDVLGVLRFAAKHKHEEIATEAARLSLSHTAKEIEEKCDPLILLAWYNYRETIVLQRREFRLASIKGVSHFISGTNNPCMAWERFSWETEAALRSHFNVHFHVLDILSRGTNALQGCSKCITRYEAARVAISEKFVDSPQFGPL